MSDETIWKFPLAIEAEQVVTAPLGAQLLHVGLDPNGQLCVWMQVDPEAGYRAITFYIVGTGHPIPIETVYLGSVVMGAYVWHVFRPTTFDEARVKR